MNEFLLVPLGDSMVALLYFYGGVAAAVFLILAFLIEAIYLYLSKWGSVWVCFLDAFLANLASVFVGVLLLAFSLRLLALLFNEGILFLALNYVLSVLVEGGVLGVMRRRGALVSLRTAFLMNLFSYAIPVVLILLVWLLTY